MIAVNWVIDRHSRFWNGCRCISVFIRNHDHGCPNVNCCPHIGGAALGTLVLATNSSGETLDRLYRSIDAQWERNTKLVEENLKLQQELEQVKLELKLERQNKFATNEQKNAGRYH